MNIDELINNWHAKASDEQDFFSKFVFEYLAFIAYLKKRKFRDSSSDRIAIQLLKQDAETRSHYLNANVFPKDIWSKIMCKLDNKPLVNVSHNGSEPEEIKWWNCVHNDINKMMQEEKDKRKGVINDLQDWGNMVEFIYSIRNNLFHGSKDPQDDRDQFLVEHGFYALRPLVDIFLIGSK